MNNKVQKHFCNKYIYIAIHDDIIKSLIIAKESYIKNNLKDKYHYTEKAIDLIFKFKESATEINIDSKELYRNLYLDLNIFLIKGDINKINSVIIQLKELKKLILEMEYKNL